MNTNEENIFCILEEFVLSLEPEDWFITGKAGNIRLNKKMDTISVVDKVKSKIAKKLSKRFEVKERSVQNNTEEKKPYYIKEPFGLPFELTEKGKFRK